MLNCVLEFSFIVASTGKKVLTLLTLIDVLIEQSTSKKGITIEVPYTITSVRLRNKHE